MIYLDYAATTPMSSTSLQAYQQAAEQFYANSSSLHDAGTEAKRALEGSRKAIATLMDVPYRGLHFTGSGSEANFLALVSLARSRDASLNHIISTDVEHSSIRNSLSWLEKAGFEITRLPVEPDGRVSPDNVAKSLRDQTALVSIQHVNSEIGSVQPLQKIGSLLKGHPAFFHSDLVQSFGKIDLKPLQCGLDSFSISAHKVHGPKGLGAAWTDPSISWKPFIPETVHEHGFRPGTVDVPATVSFAVAAKEAVRHRDENLKKVTRLKTLLIGVLREQLPEHLFIEGNPAVCSPYILGLRIHGMEGQYAMLECSQQNVGFSTGSACQVNEQKPSATLLSMGRSEEEAKSFIRLSLSSQTTEEEIQTAGSVLRDVVKRYLERSGLSTL